MGVAVPRALVGGSVPPQKFGHWFVGQLLSRKQVSRKIQNLSCICLNFKGGVYKLFSMPHPNSRQIHEMLVLNL